MSPLLLVEERVKARLTRWRKGIAREKDEIGLVDLRSGDRACGGARGEWSAVDGVRHGRLIHLVCGES